MPNRIIMSTIALIGFLNASIAQPGAPIAADATKPVGVQMADTADLGIRFVSVKPADFLFSRLTGATVYDKQNRALGTIDDFAIEDGRRISGVILSVGGFLGIGERHVVVDPAGLVINSKDGEWRAFLDTSREALKSAPEFSYDDA